jgi:hypothetical protein
MKTNSLLAISLFGVCGVLVLLSAVSYKRITSLESYSKAAYKDGFEAGSKTVSCEDSNENAFNNGVMNGLYRAKTMCGIVIRRDIK